MFADASACGQSQPECAASECRADAPQGGETASYLYIASPDRVRWVYYRLCGSLRHSFCARRCRFTQQCPFALRWMVNIVLVFDGLGDYVFSIVSSV
ncbi:hypothetical protein D3C80_2012420 [compost metagenome]